MSFLACVAQGSKGAKGVENRKEGNKGGGMGGAAKRRQIKAPPPPPIYTFLQMPSSTEIHDRPSHNE